MFRMMLFVLLAVISARPSNAATPGEQKRIADGMIAKNVKGTAIYDSDGNVTHLAISRHPASWKGKSEPLPDGVSNEEFRQILKLTELEAVFLEMQQLSDESYGLLAQLKHLKDVRIHYPLGKKAKKEQGPALEVPATDRFGLFINDLPGLTHLQFKHIFSIEGDGMQGIAPQPELVHAELDTICAKSSALAFLKQSPKITNLQLHRCEFNNEQYQELFAALPQLEIVELKTPNGYNPKKHATGAALVGLANCRHLRLLQLSSKFDQIPDEAFEVFAKLPQLQQLNLGNAVPGMNAQSPQIQKLHQARPDILINVGKDSIGGKPGQKKIPVDESLDWGGEVTTHG